MSKLCFGVAFVAFTVAVIGLGCAENRQTDAVPQSRSAANTGSAAGYPPSVADEFLKACQKSGGSQSLCECVFAKVQERYTFEEFAIIETRMAAGKIPDDFLDFSGRARGECTR